MANPVVDPALMEEFRVHIREACKIDPSGEAAELLVRGVLQAFFHAGTEAHQLPATHREPPAKDPSGTTGELLDIPSLLGPPTVSLLRLTDDDEDMTDPQALTGADDDEDMTDPQALTEADTASGANQTGADPATHSDQVTAAPDAPVVTTAVGTEQTPHPADVLMNKQATLRPEIAPVIGASSGESPSTAEVVQDPATPTNQKTTTPIAQPSSSRSLPSREREIAMAEARKLWNLANQSISFPKTPSKSTVSAQRTAPATPDKRKTDVAESKEGAHEVRPAKKPKNVEPDASGHRPVTRGSAATQGK